jgi:5-methylcytosine-specific restriction endonuclease McrA
VTLATDVHHINKLRFAPGLKYDAGNLMALCSDHHDERTRRGE